MRASLVILQHIWSAYDSPVISITMVISTYFSLLYMADSFFDGCLRVSEPLIINELQISFSQKVFTDIFVSVRGRMVSSKMSVEDEER